MATAPTVARMSFASLANLRQIVAILAQFGSIQQPLTSADGLQQTLGLVVQLANLAGLDPTWTARVQSILDDPGIFNIVLATVQYLSGLVPMAPPGAGAPTAPVASQSLAIDEQSMIDWLPVVAELLSLIAQIRGLQ